MNSTLAVPSFPHVAGLARISPRTDSELIHMTQAASADVADLACDLFHERSGAHADGCQICDRARVEVLAAKTLERAARAGLLPRGFAILRRIEDWPVSVASQAVMA